mgnify:CR=1 FL=1
MGMICANRYSPMPSNLIALEPHEMRAAVADWVEKHFHLRPSEDTVKPTLWPDATWCFPPPELEYHAIASYMRRDASLALGEDRSTKVSRLESELRAAKIALERIRSCATPPTEGKALFIFQTADAAIEAMERPDA